MNETNEDKLLKQIAVAITENPRRTTKELAEAVGISKATLHRFCGTRENLEIMLVNKLEQILPQIISIAESEYDNYIFGLRELINIHFENREYLFFSCSMQTCTIENSYWNSYMKALDNFFLKGQKAGDFKIEISNSILTEIFVSTFGSLFYAELRGRVASNGITEICEKMFLFGASTK